MKKWFGYTLLVMAIVTLAVGAASAQKERALKRKRAQWTAATVAGMTGCKTIARSGNKP